MEDESPRAELTRDWLRKAHEDLESAERLATGTPITAAASFHCQQAAEKALKGFLSWHNQPFRKTHALSDLVDQCSRIHGEFARFSPADEVLTQYASDYRYPDPDRPDPSVDEMHTALRTAREIVAFVLTRTPEEVHP